MEFLNGWSMRNCLTVVLMYGRGSRQATKISYGKFTLCNAADIKFIREKHQKKLQHQKLKTLQK